MAGNTGLGTYDNLENVVLMTADLINGLDEGASLSIGTSGLFAVYYKDAVMSRDGDNIVLNATVQQENIFTPAADSYNSAALVPISCGKPETIWTPLHNWASS